MLGIGKFPADLRAELQPEGVIHLADFVPVTFRFSGSVPGKVSTAGMGVAHCGRPGPAARVSRTA
ncbi:hypothetical protein [Mycobacterium bourgelatii]|uniref:Uncharacterized protein n=1 Tax=Mycobacterium bourgelatii TaxID=1273442 RepID=A0A7I9YPY2_MYCBU|nr:hypothetical protein [Mycobacterium bourgelatii]MCV6972901.1 hypothetical protein [Mycobacterium bourgelatii]GFG90734.1 hypothetical protein MBOU_27760 [Mycobacterium bourgelatii]